jgi:hypothetical protein
MQRVVAGSTSPVRGRLPTELVRPLTVLGGRIRFPLSGSTLQRIRRQPDIESGHRADVALAIHCPHTQEGFENRCAFSGRDREMDTVGIEYWGNHGQQCIREPILTGGLSFHRSEWARQPRLLATTFGQTTTVQPLFAPTPLGGARHEDPRRTARRYCVPTT